MRKNSTYNFINEFNKQNASGPKESVAPSLATIVQIESLAKRFSFINFDITCNEQDGSIRYIKTFDKQGLMPFRSFAGSPETAAKQVLRALDLLNLIATGLGLADQGELRLADPVVHDLQEFGYRVEFPQILSAADGKEIVVDALGLSVRMDKNMVVHEVFSQVEALKPQSLCGEEKATEVALSDFRAKLNATFSEESTVKVSSVKVSTCQTANGTRLAYDVLISAEEPRHLLTVMVDAETSEIVGYENRLRFFPSGSSDKGKKKGGKSGKQSRKGLSDKQKKALMDKIAALGFHRIPDPNKKLEDQVKDIFVEWLVDNKVLISEYIDLFVFRKGGGPFNPGVWEKVEAIKSGDDAGTYRYMLKDYHFGGVITFWALMRQLKLYLDLGLLKPEQKIKVYVADPKVRDNAYFDPQKIEIHLGVGSGGGWGLAEHIEYDLGVAWHEFGHYIVYLQTPARDLNGKHGGAMHESFGDVIGDLVMNFLCIQEFSGLSEEELLANRCVIGEYCAPPDGIRIQKNDKRTPEDETGEVHDDGLISGGAKRDYMVVCGKAQGLSLVDRMKLFGRQSMFTLSQMPKEGDAKFVDMLNGYENADAKLNEGRDKQALVAAFERHGIKRAGLDLAAIAPEIQMPSNVSISQIDSRGLQGRQSAA